MFTRDYVYHQNWLPFKYDWCLHASQIVPDVSEQAHHVIVYLVDPASVDTVTRMEEGDNEPGYQCFGGIGIGNPQFLSGWAPGNKVQKIDPKVAMRIPAGSRLVMQMHYKVLNTSPKPDQTMLRLWLTEDKPEYLLTVNPFPHFGIEIEFLILVTSNGDTPCDILDPSYRTKKTNNYQVCHRLICRCLNLRVFRPIVTLIHELLLSSA